MDGFGKAAPEQAGFADTCSHSRGLAGGHPAYVEGEAQTEDHGDRTGAEGPDAECQRRARASGQREQSKHPGILSELHILRLGTDGQSVPDRGAPGNSSG